MPQGAAGKLAMAIPIEEFLALVDCDPTEVLDIPADRLGVPSTFIPPGAEKENREYWD